MVSSIKRFLLTVYYFLVSAVHNLSTPEKILLSIAVGICMLVVIILIKDFLFKNPNRRRKFFRFFIPPAIFIISIIVAFYIQEFYYSAACCIAGYFCMILLLSLHKNDPIILTLGGLTWPLSAICRHFAIIGTTGSGKTVALREIFRQILTKCPTAGGMIIEDKSDFAEDVKHILRNIKKEEKLIVLKVNPDMHDHNYEPEYTMNLLDYRNMPYENWASLIVNTAKAFQEKENPFFIEQAEICIKEGLRIIGELQHLLDDLYEYIIDTNSLSQSATYAIPRYFALDQLYNFISIPESLADVLDAIQCFIRKEEIKRNLPSYEAIDRSINILKQNYCSIVKETRDGIRGTIANILNPFTSKDITQVFCNPNPNVNVSIIEQGKFIALSIPQHYQKEKRYLNTLIKTELFDICQQRFTNPNKKDLNLLIGIFDEAQNIVTSSDELSDHDVSAKLRSAKVCLIYATQDFKSYFPRLSKEKAAVLLLNLGTKLFFKIADPDTAEQVAKDLGTKKKYKKTYSSGKSGGSVSKQEAEEPIYTASTLRNLPDYTCVIKHVDGTIKKVKILPKNKYGLKPIWYYKRKLVGE